ncbi:MAG TPA: hypothetical protein VFG60_07175, partial [Burkholderiaceae bacterium]|nr:hypothetical protein [Burkholderiaceae bacterium]
MASRTQDITFVVPGQLEAPAARSAGRGTFKTAVRVGAQRSAGEGTPRDGAGGTLRDGTGGTLHVRARPGEDVVVLTVANGPTLVLHPEDARDLMRAQAGAVAGSARTGRALRGPDAGSDEVAVPAQLGWPGLEGAATRGMQRGWMGQVVLSAFDVITNLAKDPAATLATALITKKVDGQVDAGVYELAPDALPASLKGSGLKRDSLPSAPGGAPLLVLLHGTFVDTVSTFGKLWALHPQTVRALFTHYAGRVYGLDHPTLGESPIANALTLVRALPEGARLHLVTHSRGGLVAEVLARVCGGAPVNAEALALFKGEAYAKHRADLLALAKLVRAKAIRVERVVRVACPARGTLLASKRLDAYLSVLQWGLQLAGVPVAPQLVDFLHEVARRRADPGELPGLEAMTPASPVVAWLNSGTEPIAGDLRVVAGDIEGDSVMSWVKTLLADAFYWTDNDLVVQTRSMYGGTPRATAADGAGASFLLDSGAKVTHFNYFSNARTVGAISAALTEARPGGFQPIGPLSWAGEDASGLRAGKVARVATPERPAVFVLPGILGSNLKLDGHRIWLGLRFVNGLKKLAWDPATADRIEPDGPIGSVYDDLIESLADSHEVIPFAFD